MKIEIKKKKVFSPYSNMFALDADSVYFSVILRDKNGDENVDLNPGEVMLFSSGGASIVLKNNGKVLINGKEV